MGPRKVLGLDHFRKELRCGLQSIVNLFKFAVRKDDLSIDQLQYTFEDQVRVAHYFQQMFATRPVCSGKPVLCRPLICASPSHQHFDGLMTVAQLCPQCFCNKRVNRIAIIQEHKMILKAVENGVSEERIAKSLNVDVASIRRRRKLLDGICAEAAELLKEKHMALNTFSELRKLGAIRQIEAAELMVAMNNFFQ
jgi:hypothetical protein